MRSILLSALLLTGACGGYTSYCTEKSDCEGGNDKAIEVCASNLEETEAEAEKKGCSDDWFAFVDCVEAESSCEGDYYTDEGDCGKEYDAYYDCIYGD